MEISGISRRETLAAIGTLFCLASCSAVRRDTSNRIIETLDKRVPEKNDFSKFKPRDGVIIDSRFDLRNSKTVMHLADMHPADAQGTHVQKELWGVLNQLLETQDVINVVVESWTQGETREQFAARQMEFINTPRGAALSHWVSLVHVFEEKDPEKRLALAQQLVGNTPLLASTLAVAAFPGRINPIGATSLDNDGGRELMAQHKFISMLKRLDSTVCLPQGISLKEAWRHAKGDKPSSEAVECYCGFREQFNEATQAVSDQRKMTAGLEAQTAVQQSSPLVVIYSGAAHGPVIRDFLRESPVNYMMISPKSIEGVARDVLKKGFPKPTLLEDNKAHDCENFLSKLQSGESLMPNFL